LFKSVSQQTFISTTQTSVKKKSFCALWWFSEWQIEKVQYIILIKWKASVCCIFKKGLVV